jgi:hypothetical protein
MRHYLSRHVYKEIIMGNTNPLESLAAFVICFVAGALTTAGLGTYIGKLKRDARKS